MNNSFSVFVAFYNGSYPAPTPPLVADPHVWIQGTCNGKSVGYVAVSWSAIQRANAVSGVEGVRALLGSILLGLVNGPPYPQAPALPSGSIDIPPAVTSGAESVICQEAMSAGQWSA